MNFGHLTRVVRDARKINETQLGPFSANHSKCTWPSQSQKDQNEPKHITIMHSCVWSHLCVCMSSIKHPCSIVVHQI